MDNNSSELNLRIERIKKDNGFDTYLETLSFYLEHESDLEPEQVARHLNKKIVSELEREGTQSKILRGSNVDKVSLF